MHAAVAGDHAGLVVIAGVEHREVGKGAAERGDEQRQQGELRPVAAVGVEVRAHGFERGYLHFLHIGEVGDVALGGGHVVGDAAAHADDLHGLVVARTASVGGMIALGLAVAEVRVEVGVADTVGFGADLCEVDAEVAGAGADCGGGEDGVLVLPRFFVRRRRPGPSIGVLGGGCCAFLAGVSQLGPGLRRGTGWG